MTYRKFIMAGLSALTFSLSSIAAAQETTETEEPVQQEEVQPDFSSRESLAATLSLPVEDERVAALSEDQVIALNKSFHSWQQNAHSFSLSSEDVDALLARISEDNLTSKDIQWAVKALAEEAKFLGFADRFQEKYDQTGNEKFLTLKDKMTNKASKMRSSFEGKIGQTEAEDIDAETEAAAIEASKMAAKGSAKNAAVQQAKEKAKRLAQQKAKENAKESAKEKAKDAAKRAAKDEAKRAAKEAAKRAGRGK